MMAAANGLPADRAAMDSTVLPRWLRTSYKHFPYAAQESGRWWVLRLNHGLPEHDMYTAFIDAHPAATVVQRVSGYANYGSERGDPCLLCSADDDPMMRT
jgi:hypothetical protein